MKKTTIVALMMATMFTASIYAAENNDVVAVVNGKSITGEVFNLYTQKRIGVSPDANLPKAKRRELVEELVNRELIYQDALAKGLDKEQDVIQEIKEQTENIITQFQVNKLLEENPPSDKMLHEIYQKQVLAPASKEYKARHILLKTEEDANAIILQLNKGADFQKLAKDNSTGASASEGGELGWFSPNQMVKSFADAVEKLKPGEYTKHPVHTRFGWHVIQLEKERDVEPPPFDSVKAQLLKVAQNKMINGYLEELKKKAKIEMK